MAGLSEALRLGPSRGQSQPARAQWRRTDRLAVAMCWAAGIALCTIAGAIVIYLLFRGLQYLHLDLLLKSPQPATSQAGSGGFLDPLIGTLVLTVLGIALATPPAVAAAVWLNEYGRPRWLAKAVESGIEVVAGTPSIVLAIFGLALFQHQIFAWMSFTAAGNAVFAKSFLTASCMMALIGLPLVFGATREGLRAVPGQMREASYALGKTKIATIRRVLLPAVRRNIATGATLGMGRIAGDTAIVVILLGASLQLSPEGSVPVLGTLRGTGSTLTSYVYNNSPSGEGNAPQKAYAAAFVLLMMVVGLNFAVDIIGRGGVRRRSAWGGDR